MASVNKVILVGKLGRDPELRSTPGGASVCTLNLATTETWNDNGNRQERTEWHRVQVWGKQGENCAKYLAKGRSAYIEGRLQTRSWDDKSGVKKYSTDIVATSVQFLGGGSTSTTQQMEEPVAEMETIAPEARQSSHNPSEKYASLDDIPF